MQWDSVVIVDGGGGGGAVPRRNIGELCGDGDGTRAPPPPTELRASTPMQTGPDFSLVA